MEYRVERYRRQLRRTVVDAETMSQDLRQIYREYRNGETSPTETVTRMAQSAQRAQALLERSLAELAEFAADAEIDDPVAVG